MMELRNYQIDAINSLRQSVASGDKRVVLQSPTGSGKTVCAASIVNSANSKGVRVLFLVDTLDLLNQAIETFQKMGIDVGVMQGQLHELDNPQSMCQVCTVQTLASRIKKQPDAWRQYPVGLIIIDECDRQFAVREKLAEIYPDIPFLGLSGTPYAKGLGKFYQSLVIAVPMKQLIADGYLKPFRIFAPSEPDLEGVKLNAKGDYDADQTSKRYTQPLIANIVKTWLELGERRPTIGFGVNVAHSKAMAAEFKANGIVCEHVDGYGSDEVQEERFEIIRRFKAGEIEVLFNVALASRGFDAPHVSCIIDAAPTKSMALFTQKWGRGTRICTDHSDCIVLDHSGNVSRLGRPEDYIIHELDDGTKGNKSDRKPKEDPLPKPCPKCSFVKEPRQHKCPNCGFAPERQSDIEVVDGELVEYTKGAKFTIAQKTEWMQMLATYGRGKGYKKGWAIYKFKEKFEEEPPVLWPKKDVELSPEVRSWLRHLNIKNAKRREKQQGHNNAAA